jgi:hypothetical protein
MELCYRGVTHSCLSKSIATVETETQARFLGKTYKIRRPIYQPGQDQLNLVYRGVAYSTGNNPAIQPQSCQPSTYIAKLARQLGI